MRAPVDLPPAIRTDRENSFAHHTMSVRVPAIVESVLAHDPQIQPERARAITRLASDMRENAELPPPDPALPDACTWQTALAERGTSRWLESDWFFAENYAYRTLCEKLSYWQSHRDPFLPTNGRSTRATAIGWRSTPPPASQGPPTSSW